MRYLTDFHLHTKYSRATSKYLGLEELTKWGHIKGLEILGTADFTHPKWFAEIKEKFEPAGEGLYTIQSKFLDKTKLPASVANRPFSFMLTSEVSCIYSKGGKVRRLHILLAFPSIEDVEKFNTRLTDRGCKLAADGRPILGIDAKELATIAFDVSEFALVIPAHAWTPWFAIFGSKSGFDSIEECYEELSDRIYAVETGMSSDPPMNWRMRDLQNRFVVSNSDAHSGPKIGREANVFELERPSYFAIFDALKQRDTSTFLETIEFYPQEGMYHYDGHRKCGVRMHPDQTKKLKGICPKCQLPLTIGVLSQVEKLAAYPAGHVPKNVPKHRYLVPLPEILSEVLGKGWQTKTVQAAYFKMIEKGGDEFHLLLDMPIQEIRGIGGEIVAHAIEKMRAGDLSIEPGYDGVYGTVSIFKPGELERLAPKQKSLL
jgi:uncharacterized protein (TIGR00375 family)